MAGETRTVFAPPRLTPPRRRSDTIRRPRLHRLLDDALDHEVIVLSAPAGYGKTTLAADWLEEVGLPVAWLTLDRNDRDPLSLLTDLAAAVRVAFPGSLSNFETALERAGAGGGPAALEAEFTSAVQAEIDELFLLAVDGLDVLADADEALALLDTLVQATPSGMRLLLVTRSRALVPSLARLAVRRQAASVDAATLKFTDDEAMEFLRSFGIADAAACSALIDRADGWAAALAILAEHYREEGRLDGDSGDFVLDDFIEQEVLARLPEDHLLLLQACAVLESFDVAMARELAGDPDAAARLRELERTTHLIVRLEDRDWYRMHGILREHLLGRMSDDQPQRLLMLGRAAAQLYAERGMHREAIETALDVELWPLAVGEIHEMQDELYQRAEWVTLSGWLDRLPPDVLASDPDLVLLRARMSLKTRDARAGLARLDAMAEEDLTPEQRARRELFRGVALRNLGQLMEALEACRGARAMAGELIGEERRVFADIDLEEAIVHGMRGELERARQLFESAARSFEQTADHHRAAEAHHALGTMHAYRGQYIEALREQRAAQQLWEMLGDSYTSLTTANNIAHVQYLMGDLEAARRDFNATIERARERRNRLAEASAREGLARSERDLGHLENARALFDVALNDALELNEAHIIADAMEGLATTCLELGDHLRARRLLEQGLRTAEQAGSQLRQAQFRNGLAAAALREQRIEDATFWASTAAEMAENIGARQEEAAARLLLAACHDAEGRAPERGEALDRVHRLVAQVGFDQYLRSYARQWVPLLEQAARERVGGEYFRGLVAELRPAAPHEPVPEAPPERTQIRAEAFGDPRVFVAGRLVTESEWRSERSKEMLLLLLEAARPMRKERIALDLWPELDQRQVNSAFHSTLHRLRRAVDREIVIRRDGGYEVNGGDFEISYDGREFDACADAAEQAGHGSDAWRTALEAAITLYQGSFAEPYDSEWVEQRRRRYEDRYLQAVIALAEDAAERGDGAGCIRLAESALSVDPLNEQAIRLQLRAYAESGRTDLARRAYRRHVDAMRDQLGETPSAAVQLEYEAIEAGAAE